MRLKGGKLLLDLTDFVISLTQEEIDCILSKGLVLRIPKPYILPNSSITIEINFDGLLLDAEDNVVGVEKLIYSNGDNYASIQLNIEDKTLSYIEL